jgi:hypothetical protein
LDCFYRRLMKIQGKHGYLLMYIIMALGVAGILWVAYVNAIKPQLKQAARAKIVEAVLQECFINGLEAAKAMEKNIRDAYEVKSEKQEYDEFSKTAYRVVERGRKKWDPEQSCTINIKREKLLAFMSEINSKFVFSEQNKFIWGDYTAEMKKRGVLAPGTQDLQVYFLECDRAKKLYDGLQAFFALSKGYGYNFAFTLQAGMK